MKQILYTLQRWEFEARIFISLLIVLVVCSLCYGWYASLPTLSTQLGAFFGVSVPLSTSLGFSCAAFLLAISSLLRMWAGTILQSERIMAFRIQSDRLLGKGPYRIVRNPIYLADLLAMCAFSLCLPYPGMILPLLFTLHYIQIIQYEERSLQSAFKKDFEVYYRTVPRLMPTVRSFRSLGNALHEFSINWDGFRYNALYVLFIPGCLVASYTGEFFYAVLIGLPAVFDWAVHHTKKGLAVREENREQQEAKSIGRSNRVFQDILYAQCWEDPQLDRKAFQITEGDIVFTITSGGCNALAFLLDNPAKVIALDINPCQNHLLELKIAAFKALSHNELLEFIGVHRSEVRYEQYLNVRHFLNETSRNYWDTQRKKIEYGILHCGLFERYMKLLRIFLYCIIGKKTLAGFFSSESVEERVALFRSRWEGPLWWVFTTVLLSRSFMSLLFDKAFFRYLDRSFSFGRNFSAKVKQALTLLPLQENNFLSYILLGTYPNARALPLYLRPENNETIRERLDRIETMTDTCEHYFSTLPDSCITRFNFTNIFEWMPDAAYEQLLRSSVRVGREGAVMTYRNLLVYRERPSSLQDVLLSDRRLARELHNVDCSFIYDNYVVERISKEHTPCPILLEESTIVDR
ncbi:MAG: DUF3419 family protein [bacterium]